MLLGLEYLSLIVPLLFVIYLNVFIKQYILLLVRVLGLIILISIVWIYGNGYLKSVIIL